MIHEELRAELQSAQDTQAKYYNRKASVAPEFKPDQLVWLLRRNIKTTCPSLKLDHRRLGPYPIVRKIGSSAYLLRLPSYLSRLHPVFNVSLLKPYTDPSEFHTHTSPLPFTLADNPVNDIKAILDCRKIGHRYEYLVRWKSLPESDDSWLPLSDIPTSLNELLERYHRRHPRSPCPHIIDINKNYHTSSAATDTSLSLSSQVPSSVAPPEPPVPALAAVPPAAARPLSPVAVRQRLRSEYEPPTQTTTRGGRVSCPAERLNL
jgi:hypothetical protein